MRFFYLEEVNLIPAMCLCLKAISRNVFHLQASLKWANAQLISKHLLFVRKGKHTCYLVSKRVRVVVSRDFDPRIDL